VSRHKVQWWAVGFRKDVDKCLNNQTAVILKKWFTRCCKLNGNVFNSFVPRFRSSVCNILKSTSYNKTQTGTSVQVNTPCYIKVITFYFYTNFRLTREEYIMNELLSFRNTTRSPLHPPATPIRNLPGT
jgi:hypothetical protein